MCNLMEKKPLSDLEEIAILAIQAIFAI